MHGVCAVNSERSRHSHGGADGTRSAGDGPTSATTMRQGTDSEIANTIRHATDAIRELIADTNDVGIVVLESRIAAAAPATLAETGRRAGRSGELIRRIESRLRSQAEEALRPFLAQVLTPLTDWLGDFADDDRIRGAVAVLAGGNDDLAGRIISRKLMAELGYQDNAGLWASRQAIEAADRLVAQARDFSDDFGCVDEERLRQTEIGRRWSVTWDELLSVAGLTRVCGVLVIAVTRRAQVAAALRSFGRPATKAEIEDRLRPEVDGRMFRVDVALAGMEAVVRASKTTWGFEEWVDDVYEGIPAEIRQRINEDGGSTRLTRLLEEIPRLFDVRESSVRAYLETPAFVVEHGWVREANSFSGPVGTLGDVTDGVTAAGDPYWTFKVESRFLKGYSLPSVPPEVSIALGAGFGEKSLVSVRIPSGCGKISVIWRPTSKHGPEIGRLATVLQALQATGGEQVCLMIHGNKEVSFAHASAIAKKSSRPDGSDKLQRSISVRQSGVRTAAPLRARLSISQMRK